MLQRNRTEKNEQPNPKEDKPLVKWIKKGDFSKIFNRGANLNRMVEYHNIKASIKNKEEIFIGGYHGSDKLKIIFFSKKLAKKLLAKCKELEILVKDDLIAVGGVCLHTNDKKIMAAFLNAIDDLIPLSKEIKGEIFNTLDLKQIAEKSFYNDIKTLVHSNKFEEALKLAKSVDDDHILWQLGSYCESKQKFSEAINSYQEISENNPHYQEANYLSAHLIMQYLNTADKEEQNLTSDEKRQYQESEFRFMLRANQDTSNQRLVDQIFHQLCGGNDLNPSVTGVKLDENTLIALAQEASLLRKDNLAMNKKNKLLMDEIATLKKRLAKPNNNESTYKQGLFNPAKTITKKKSDTYCGFKPGFLIKKHF